MEIRKVSDRFSVAPQLLPEHLGPIAKAGYRLVISNRPDGEEDGQPSTEAMRTAAEDAGIAFVHIPISGGEFSDDKIDAFRDVVRAADGPVLAFCRTGTRSINLAALANPVGLSAAQRLERASAAGYDLSGIADRL